MCANFRSRSFSIASIRGQNWSRIFVAAALYAPHKLGYKLTKYLTTVTFTAERPGGYWEDQGYPWFGGV